MGLFNTSDSDRTSVLNGNHKTLCYEDDKETVLVFPDFKVVTEVHRSVQGAHELWENAVNPVIRPDSPYRERGNLKTWILPYSHVILLCECFQSPASNVLNDLISALPGSHKKRDNRCGIAAPKLEHGKEHRSIVLCPSYSLYHGIAHSAPE